jgi:HrpA-like RNA helicase
LSILCSQPRRVAALSVAERVSEELGEERVGGLVGYSIRLESRKSASTRLLFCTTGIILRRLVDDPNLEGVSHLVLDEVHERQWQIDVLFTCIRFLLRTSRPDLKVILVSYTSRWFCLALLRISFWIRCLQLWTKSFSATTLMVLQ